MDHLNESMQKASQNQDGPRIVELSQAIHTCQSAIDQLFDELETITDEFDLQNAVFEDQLKQLESEMEGGMKTHRAEGMEHGDSVKG